MTGTGTQRGRPCLEPLAEEERTAASTWSDFLISSRPTTGQIYRAIGPKRKWWAWAAALLFLWLVTLAPGAWLGNLGILLSILICRSAALALLTWLLPGILAAVTLLTDLRAERLTALILTPVDRLKILRAYHFRALSTIALIQIVLAPSLFWYAPAPLAFLNESDFIAISSDFGPGLLIDISVAWFAAAVGLALAVWTGRLGWALPLTVLAVLLMGALVYSCGAVIINLPKPGRDLPHYLWLFTMICSPVALGVAELALRLAARRLDRLVTD